MPTKSSKRAVKKKNGLSSVDGAAFFGSEAKNTASVLPDIMVEVTVSKQRRTAGGFGRIEI
jgi:hypothetical protein